MAQTDGDLLGAWRAGDDAAGRAFFLRWFNTVHTFFGVLAAEQAEHLVEQTLFACRDRGDRHPRAVTMRSRVLRLAVETYRANPCETPEGPVHPLRQLPIDDRLVIQLAYMQCVSHREVADILDISDATLRQRMRAAMNALRRRMLRPRDDIPDDVA